MCPLYTPHGSNPHGERGSGEFFWVNLKQKTIGGKEWKGDPNGPGHARERGVPSPTNQHLGKDHSLSPPMELAPVDTRPHVGSAREWRSQADGEAGGTGHPHPLTLPRASRGAGTATERGKQAPRTPTAAHPHSSRVEHKPKAGKRAERDNLWPQDVTAYTTLIYI